MPPCATLFRVSKVYAACSRALIVTLTLAGSFLVNLMEEVVSCVTVIVVHVVDDIRIKAVRVYIEIFVCKCSMKNSSTSHTRPLLQLPSLHIIRAPSFSLKYRTEV